MRLVLGFGVKVQGSSGSFRKLGDPIRVPLNGCCEATIRVPLKRLYEGLEFPKIRRYFIWVLHNEDPTIEGTILGSPILGNSHIGQPYNLQSPKYVRLCTNSKPLCMGSSLNQDPFLSPKVVRHPERGNQYRTVLRGFCHAFFGSPFDRLLCGFCAGIFCPNPGPTP